MFGPKFAYLLNKNMNTFQSEFDVLKSVILKHPKEAFISVSTIEKQWKSLNYKSAPDLNKAIDEYEAFIEILKRHKIEINFLPENENTGLDSVYVRDASISCNAGMIICNMGKAAREDEPRAQQLFYKDRNIVINGVIVGEAKIEGGDVAWIDESTIAVARGYRTNDTGIARLKELLRDCAEKVIVVHSPHYKGPLDVFHLMSVFSPVNKDLAVVYSPLMTVSFREELLRRSIKLVEVPDNEFKTMGCNVLAIAPGVCIMTEGNPVTKSILESAGAEVFTYKGEEISSKGNGGPTCLTRPLVRVK